MSDHTFLVTVTVDGWEHGGDADRTPAEYAAAALWGAGLRDADNLEGFADLHAEADITGVQEIQ